MTNDWRLRPQKGPHKSVAEYIQELASYTKTYVPRHVFSPCLELEAILENRADDIDEIDRLREIEKLYNQECAAADEILPDETTVPASKERGALNEDQRWIASLMTHMEDNWRAIDQGPIERARAYLLSHHAGETTARHPDCADGCHQAKTAALVEDNARLLGRLLDKSAEKKSARSDDQFIHGDAHPIDMVRAGFGPITGLPLKASAVNSGNT